jgi:hypothetical protein
MRAIDAKEQTGQGKRQGEAFGVTLSQFCGLRYPNSLNSMCVCLNNPQAADTDENPERSDFLTPWTEESKPEI